MSDQGPSLVDAVASLIDRFPVRHLNPNDPRAPERYLKSYVEDLEDLPEPLVVAAILRLRKTATFMPSVAEIRGLIAEAATPDLSPGEAWRAVEKAISRHGVNGYERVAFADQAVADAVRSVGWRRLCLDDNSKGYVRLDFERALSTAQQRVRRDVQTGVAALPVGGNLVALDRKAS